MVSPDDLPCTERESDDGDQLQGGPFPPRCYSHGRALVCGVSLELSACRRAPGGAWGGGGSRDHPALGGEVQSRVGGSLSSPQASSVGELAHGSVPDATCKNALVSPQALCVEAVPPEGWSQKGEGNAHPLLLP